MQLLDGGVKQLRDDTDALEVKKGLCINYVDDGGIDGDGQKIDIGLGPEGEDFQSKIRVKKKVSFIFLIFIFFCFYRIWIKE